MTVRIEATRVGRVAVPLPAYQTDGAVGLDLHAAIDSPRILAALSVPTRALIPTGWAIAIPEGYEGYIRPRSGLALKHGIHVLGGTIDADFRGEIGVILVNLGGCDVVVRPGDRIAQLVIAPVARAELVEVDALCATDRGSDGYGSTGVGVREALPTVPEAS